MTSTLTVKEFVEQFGVPVDDWQLRELERRTKEAKSMKDVYDDKHALELQLADEREINFKLQEQGALLEAENAQLKAKVAQYLRLVILGVEGWGHAELEEAQLIYDETEAALVKAAGEVKP